MRTRVVVGGAVVVDVPFHVPMPELLSAHPGAEVTYPHGPDDVRAEASRRMCVLTGARGAAHLAVVISNAQRESARLYAIRIGIPGVVAPRDWTADEATRAAQLHGANAAIEAIRAASNAMETDPPADYAADAHWPPS